MQQPLVFIMGIKESFLYKKQTERMGADSIVGTAHFLKNTP